MRPQKTDLPFSTKPKNHHSNNRRTHCRLRSTRPANIPVHPRATHSDRNTPPPAPPARRWNACIGATEREGARGGGGFLSRITPGHLVYLRGGARNKPLGSWRA